MEQFNDDQKKAVTHVDGPMMVLAGPGSGKTFVITRRLRYLIEERHVSPEKILVITFTKAAALEMEERFRGLMGDNFSPVRFGTFHAVFYSILKASGNSSYKGIISENEKAAFIKTALNGLCLKDKKYSQEDFSQKLLEEIAKAKNSGLSPVEYRQEFVDKEIFEKIFGGYEKIMRSLGKVDFEDMVLECRKLLLRDQGLLERCRNNFKYILIDEFQDINPVQYQVIKMIAEPLNNLFIVGDDDQSIYGFRGSKPEIMLNFPKDYKDAVNVNLKQNYRSSKEIVENATAFIENNKNRFKKKLFAAGSLKGSVVIKAFENSEEEARHIIKKICTAKKMGAYSDNAIIFRTNAGAMTITRYLFAAKIPFVYREKSKSFFSNPFIKDILSILRFADGENTRENLFRFMNKPFRYISRDFFTSEKVNFNEILIDNDLSPGLRESIKRLQYDLEMVKKFDAFCAVNYIRRGMGYEGYAIKQAGEMRLEKREVIEILDYFQEICEKCESLKGLEEYINEYDEAIKPDAAGKNENKDAVTIITMHGSKGLEYKNVFIPGLNEGYVPQSKAKSKEEIEEERRVFYVAMTRAKENLFMSYISKNKENRLLKSRFLSEIKNIREED